MALTALATQDMVWVQGILARMSMQLDTHVGMCDGTADAIFCVTPMEGSYSAYFID